MGSTQVVSAPCSQASSPDGAMRLSRSAPRPAGGWAVAVAGPRSPVVPAIGPSPCPPADAMVGNGGTAVTVVACCLAWREST